MATKTLITLEEFDALPDDGLKHEVNKGELVTMPLPSPFHNRVIRLILVLLERYPRTESARGSLSPGYAIHSLRSRGSRNFAGT